MKRAILLLLVVVATLQASCAIHSQQHIRTDEIWYGQLRELAVDIVKSEGGFFPRRELYIQLLDTIKKTDPKIKASIFNKPADAMCQYWRCDLDESGKYYIEICFQNWDRDPDGRLYIGVVDLVMRRRMTSGDTEFSMRSIRPRQVTDYFGIYDAADAERKTPDLESGKTTKRLTKLFNKSDRDL